MSNGSNNYKKIRRDKTDGFDGAFAPGLKKLLERTLRENDAKIEAAERNGIPKPALAPTSLGSKIWKIFKAIIFIGCRK